MIKTQILISRPGSSYKKLPKVDLDSLPRVGDKIWYRNQITNIKRKLVVTQIEHVVEVGDDGVGQRVNVYCDSDNKQP